MSRRTPFAVGAILALVACSPVVRVEVTFVHPSGRLDPSRLHLRGRVACDSFNLADPPPKPPRPPSPGLEEASDEPDMFTLGDASDAGLELAKRRGPASEEHNVVFEREDAKWSASFRASHCFLAMTAFYDENGDGVVGAGDLLGTVEPTELYDRGLCAGNLTTIGPVRLAPLR